MRYIYIKFRNIYPTYTSDSGLTRVDQLGRVEGWGDIYNLLLFPKDIYILETYISHLHVRQRLDEDRSFRKDWAHHEVLLHPRFLEDDVAVLAKHAHRRQPGQEEHEVFRAHLLGNGCGIVAQNHGICGTEALDSGPQALVHGVWAVLLK